MAEKTFQYAPLGVCSKLMNITVDDNGTIVSAQVLGGCHGNLQGICRLIEGQKVGDVIPRIQGIRCGNKPTSCPDQLSIALSQIAEQLNK